MNALRLLMKFLVLAIIDIFDDFVLIYFDLLGHLLMLYIMMLFLALYTSQI